VKSVHFDTFLPAEYSPLNSYNITVPVTHIYTGCNVSELSLYLYMEFT